MYIATQGPVGGNYKSRLYTSGTAIDGNEITFQNVFFKE